MTHVELAAWSAYMAAVTRVDVNECVRLWAAFWAIYGRRAAKPI